MTTIIRPGAGILFMKVGSHAQETLEDIIVRKTKEIEDTGFGMWGYGGNTCHPRTMVQPFARTFEQRGQAIYLCMEEMESNHFAQPVRAEQFSIDGINWEEIPSTINVRGSRYALIINELRQEDFDLPLSRTRVAIGNSNGRPGHQYIRGRVDKACLEVLDSAASSIFANDRTIHIGLTATLAEPYAVLLRNRD